MSYSILPLGPTPWGEGRRSFRRLDTGWPVAALQINLGVTADGSFGPLTEATVEAVQRRLKLKTDGIAGPATQKAICLDRTTAAWKQYKTPTGLLRGIMESESGFLLAAFSDHPSDAGYDLGAYQDAFPPRSATQANIHHGLDVAAMANETAAKIRGKKGAYVAANRSLSVRSAWRYATLYHNWPYAADRLAKGENGMAFGWDSDASWVVDASGGRLRTPHQWAESYMAKTCRYVTNYTD